jgi:pimeloyl-ACP methyl ester carboxylesterase
MESGPVDADEAAVFIHGNPGSIRDWKSLVRDVGEFGRALAMDMPGFGDADKPADFDYSVRGYASFLR